MFELKNKGQISYLTGKMGEGTFGFTDRSIGPDPRAAFEGAFGIQPQFIRQVHGKDIWDLRFQETAPVEADGVIFSLPMRGKAAFGVLTADCTPVLIRSADVVALLHVGWRGLAAGIIEEAIARMPKSTSLRAWIGPCARACCYEVKGDVIEALGSKGVIKQVGSKSTLCMASSCQTLIRSLALSCDSSAEVDDTGVCTICDKRFYSHRRERADAYRNLSFVIT